MFNDVVLAEYVRDEVVESEHRGFLVMLNADGSIFKSHGDVNAKVFPRSAIKCAQASAMVRNGLVLEPRLLALSQSSHSGGDIHMDGAREILASVGLDESALQCALDRPIGEAEKRAWGDKPAARIAMNCSGKHSAMLATCVKNGWPIENYLDQNHPLQVAIKKELEDLSGEKITLTSTDGCGAPLFLLSILGIARVAGETAPLLLTMGGADAVNLNPFNGNSSAIPFYVWKNFSMGTEVSIQRAWSGVLVLMIIVLIFFSLTRFSSNRKGRF